MASKDHNEDKDYSSDCAGCSRQAVVVICSDGHKIILPCFTNPEACLRPQDDYTWAFSCKACSTMVVWLVSSMHNSKYKEAIEDLKALVNSGGNKSEDESCVNFVPFIQLVKRQKFPPSSGPISKELPTDCENVSDQSNRPDLRCELNVMPAEIEQCQKEMNFENLQMLESLRLGKMEDIFVNWATLKDAAADGLLETFLKGADNDYSTFSETQLQEKFNSILKLKSCMVPKQKSGVREMTNKSRKSVPLVAANNLDEKFLEDNETGDALARNLAWMPEVGIVFKTNEKSDDCQMNEILGKLFIDVKPKAETRPTT